MGIQGTRQGSIIPLKEIATIKDAFMEAEDESRLNLEQNVTVYVKKTSQANTIPVVENIRGVLDQFHEENKDKLDVILISDKAKLIEEALTDVKGALYVGVVLVVALIYIFMRSWILALIVFISIPASVIATFIFMAALNISINVMTLSALALAIGILVDSSVVIIENIFSKKEKKYTDVRAILEGSEEVFAPLLASLATTLVVFVPILFIDKKIQIQYSGFSLTIVASLISSFMVAQMLIPMLMMQWTRGKLKPVEKEKTFFGGIERAYSRLMRLNIKSRYVVLFAVLLLFGFTSSRLAKRSIDLPSTLQENEFSIVVFPLAGARLEANSDAIKKVEELLSKIKDIEIFSSTVRKDDVRVFVRLKPRSQRTYSKDEIMDLVDKQGNEMVKEIHDDYSLIVDEGASASEDKKLIVNIFGQDGDELQKLAMEFSNRMGKVEGLTNIVMTDLRKRPEYTLVVDRGRAALYGLTAQKIADSIHAQVRGMRPTKYHEVLSGEEIEVITRLQAIYRQKLDDLKFIHMQTDSGKQIPLGEVANFYPSVGPQTIDRMDKYRYVFVKGDCRGALEKVAEDIRKALADVKLPDEYYWRFGGAYDDLIGSKSQLSLALLLTLFLVYGTMACLFQSYLQPLLIMISVPLATIGIYIALEATKTPLSNQVFIGMIILAGYVVSAAIMLMDRTNHLKKEGLTIQAAVTQAGVDRLRPIVMTTLSTTFGFAPMALGWGQSSDLWAPLAVTVIGGLLSSTCLTLFVLPNMLIMCRDIGLLLSRIKLLLKSFFSLLPKFKHTTGA
nr:efflux RND transporter permease subunit [Candidatus Omnitrophota bacterium]